MKKIITIVLCLCFAIISSMIFVGNKTSIEASTNKYYIALGDSIGEGYGINLKTISYENEIRQVSINSAYQAETAGYEFIQNSYADLINKELKNVVTHGINFSQSGDTCGDLLNFINGFYDYENNIVLNGSNFNSKYGTDTLGDLDGSKTISNGNKPLTNSEIFEMFQNAKVITVCIGANNILGQATSIIPNILFGTMSVSDAEGVLKDCILGKGTSGASGYIKGLDKEFEELSERLSALCPNAKIFYTNIYNPYATFNFSETLKNTIISALNMMSNPTSLSQINQRINDIVHLCEVGISGGKDSNNNEFVGINDIISQYVDEEYLIDTKSVFDEVLADSEKTYNDYVNTEGELLNLNFADFINIFASKDYSRIKTYLDPHPTYLGHSKIFEEHKNVYSKEIAEDFNYDITYFKNEQEITTLGATTTLAYGKSNKYKTQILVEEPVSLEYEYVYTLKQGTSVIETYTESNEYMLDTYNLNLDVNSIYRVYLSVTASNEESNYTKNLVSDIMLEEFTITDISFEITSKVNGQDVNANYTLKYGESLVFENSIEESDKYNCTYIYYDKFNNNTTTIGNNSASLTFNTIDYVKGEHILSLKAIITTKHETGAKLFNTDIEILTTIEIVNPEISLTLTYNEQTCEDYYLLYQNIGIGFKLNVENNSGLSFASPQIKVVLKKGSSYEQSEQVYSEVYEPNEMIDYGETLTIGKYFLTAVLLVNHNSNAFNIVSLPEIVEIYIIERNFDIDFSYTVDSTTLSFEQNDTLSIYANKTVTITVNTTHESYPQLLCSIKLYDGNDLIMFVNENSITIKLSDLEIQTYNLVFSVMGINGEQSQPLVRKEKFANLTVLNAVKYKVSFVTYTTSSIPSKDVYINDMVTAPETILIKEHFTFLGWCSDYNCENIYDFNTPIISDRTLYAKWQENPKLTYDANGGEGVVPEPVWASSLDGEKIYLQNGSLHKEGYLFYGWSIEKFCTNYNLSDDNSIILDTDLTMYAIWIGVSFVPNYNLAYQEFNSDGTLQPITAYVDFDVDLNLPIEWVITKGQNNVRIPFFCTTKQFSYLPNDVGAYKIYAKINNSYTTPTFSFTVNYAPISSISIKCYDIVSDRYYYFMATCESYVDDSQLIWYCKYDGSNPIIIGQGMVASYAIDTTKKCQIYCEASSGDSGINVTSNILQYRAKTNFDFLVPIAIVAGIALLVFVPVIIKFVQNRRRDHLI